MLVPKDASLLGKMFEVDVIATGKHFMKSEVVKESLVHARPRPLPLPLGSVSGVQVWKTRTNSEPEKGSSSLETSSSLALGSVQVCKQAWWRFITNAEPKGPDFMLLLFAALVILVALFLRYLT